MPSCTHVQPPPPLRRPLPRTGHTASVRNPCTEKNVQSLAELPHPVVAILPGAETGVELADLLAARLGTRNNGEDLTLARRNKYLMGEQVRYSGDVVSTSPSQDPDALHLVVRRTTCCPVRVASSSISVFLLMRFFFRLLFPLHPILFCEFRLLLIAISCVVLCCSVLFCFLVLSCRMIRATVFEQAAVDLEALTIGERCNTGDGCHWGRDTRLVRTLVKGQDFIVWAR